MPKMTMQPFLASPGGIQADDTDGTEQAKRRGLGQVADIREVLERFVTRFHAAANTGSTAAKRVRNRGVGQQCTRQIPGHELRPRGRKVPVNSAGSKGVPHSGNDSPADRAASSRKCGNMRRPGNRQRPS